MSNASKCVIMKKIKAVLFDLGNTLVKTWTPEVTYQNVLVSLGFSRSAEEIRAAIDQTEGEFRKSGYRSQYGIADYVEYWEKWDASVLRNLGISEKEIPAKEILLRWFDYADCSLHVDTMASLSGLRKMGVKVGLISTAYEEDITAILNKVGLQRSLFDVVIGANTIKKEKPHPDVFLHALSKLGVKAEEALFVGDHIDNDYRGARAVGIHALLIDREGKGNDSGLQRIKSLCEVLGFTQ